ncbi:hypothetical protein D3C75_1110320 [compost metagenome]
MSQVVHHPLLLLSHGGEVRNLLFHSICHAVEMPRQLPEFIPVLKLHPFAVVSFGNIFGAVRQ